MAQGGADSEAMVAAECPAVEAPGPIRCAQSARGYRDGWIWISTVAPGAARSVELRASRFQSVRARFRYADGAVIEQRARAGEFGSFWQIGGTVRFRAPARAAPLAAIALGVERQDWDRLLKITIGGAAEARAPAGASLLIGAALALLLLSTLGNLLLGAAARRAAPVWNAAWAGCVLGWALMWTHVVLFAAPGLAGPSAARLGTLFSTAAIGCAGGFFLASAGEGLARWARRGLAALSAAVLLAGLVAAGVSGARLPDAALLLNGAVALLALGLSAACAAQWRAGNRQARGFALSFAVPMLAVLWSIFADRGISNGDAGGMYLVLVACALQTLWLTIASALQLWAVRAERDAAKAAESRMSKLAETDPLTGLLNRRGFVERAETLLAGPASVTLILLDLDRFKHVNDRFGHDIGDAVLCAAAAALTWIPEAEAVGRLGGEEFGLLATGLAPDAAIAVANQARAAIGAEDVLTERGYIGVTASAGISCAPPGTEFGTLYKAADRALYRAKEAGRDRAELAATLVRAA